MSRFDEVYAAFKSAYPEGSKESEDYLVKYKWDQFEQWREEVRVALPELTLGEQAQAGKTAWDLITRGNRYDGHPSNYIFAIYCCRQPLAWAINNNLSVDIVSLLEILGYTRVTKLKTTASPLLAYLSRVRPQDLGKAVAKVVERGSPVHLDLLQQNEKLLGHFVLAITSPVEVLNTVLHESDNDPHKRKIANTVVTRFPTEIESAVVSEVREDNLNTIATLRKADFYPVGVLRELLNLVKNKWLWITANQKRWDRLSLGNLRLLCDFVTAPPFSEWFSDVTEVLIGLLLFLDPAKEKKEKEEKEFRDYLLNVVGEICSKGQLPELLYELERDKRAIEKEDHYTYLSRQTALQQWSEKRAVALARFPHEFAGGIQRLIDLLNRFVDRDRWGTMRLASEQKRLLMRAEAVQMLRRVPHLLTTSLPLLLRRYPEIEDDVISIITSSIQDQSIDCLKDLAAQDENRDVQLRAKLIVGHIEGVFSEGNFPPNEFTSVSQMIAYYNDIISSRGRAYSGHTWLEDEMTEQIFHDAFRRADDDFSDFFTANHSKHEEGLTERLLVYLEEHVRPLTSFLATWGKKLADGPIKVSFSYRDTQPQEPHWNADLAFSLQCSVKGRIMKRHAMLIQCKKMSYDTRGQRFRGSWNIDISQCDNLILRSPFSYYFLFGPGEPAAIRTLVVPATTIRSVARATDPSGDLMSKSLQVRRMRPVSRSLADFLLYDFIGCWVGDENAELVEFAEGTNTSGPPARYLVSIEISQGVQG